ncbi:UDP-N-acetylglucosamine/UDP-N-acetylgalactosaminediphosphorylase [Singulisphaera sp. GP187]|uniref:UTP--glucose-1-phosphate uridylyltransferase n=1 Tax=Singulisphaera sp. GP187 TaxID=1882752 RepID=UPI000929AB07|nr:UTP--glucose-1-phosphate uridylyltransferase [Singulisphaera sp. GP187]SIN82149.1 UDP-N-acetylglucosamine/UDP-N-acetylgalactosaminediphosphorylase [Singulisphaera sp. GP187]
MAPDRSLVERLARHGQDSLLRWWDDLGPTEQADLVSEIERLDLDQIDTLIAQMVRADQPPATPPDQVEPIEVFRLPKTDGERVARRHVAEIGANALAAGEVGVVIVAGGSGTRLGFEGPKGTYAIGSVSGASLFQIHAEKIVAMGRRHGKPLPLYIMTSPENHEATALFFKEHDNFGLEHVRFFVQGQLPAVDQTDGKILLASKGHLALSPDGHGGTLAALAARPADGAPSCLDELRERGIRTLFYFQVDNPLVQIADPAFLGLHREADAELSFKVIEKVAPDEKVGVVVRVEGRPQVIEYSDLPTELAERREPDGSLALWAGSIAVHILEREFIERLVDNGGHQLPFHRAIKKVSFVNEAGELVQPEAPNAVKFERFIFDALPQARRWTLVETDRAVEFEPLKNATGPDSPATVRQRMSDLFAGWLESSGVRVPRRNDGSVPFGIEVSPLFALDAEELKAKVSSGLVIDGPLYLR